MENIHLSMLTQETNKWQSAMSENLKCVKIQYLIIISLHKYVTLRCPPEKRKLSPFVLVFARLAARC